MVKEISSSSLSTESLHVPPNSCDEIVISDSYDLSVMITIFCSFSSIAYCPLIDQDHIVLGDIQTEQKLFMFQSTVFSNISFGVHPQKEGRKLIQISMRGLTSHIHTHTEPTTIMNQVSKEI